MYMIGKQYISYIFTQKLTLMQLLMTNAVFGTLQKIIQTFCSLNISFPPPLDYTKFFLAPLSLSPPLLLSFSLSSLPPSPTLSLPLYVFLFSISKLSFIIFLIWWVHQVRFLQNIFLIVYYLIDIKKEPRKKKLLSITDLIRCVLKRMKNKKTWVPSSTDFILITKVSKRF